jgi:hypothetical protein
VDLCRISLRSIGHKLRSQIHFEHTADNCRQTPERATLVKTEHGIGHGHAKALVVCHLAQA